jgi:ssDNA-binding Zn-finger/Zn-ribbon topoisomerase 1
MSVTLSQVTAGRRLKLNMSRTFTAAFALHGESLADAGYKGTTPDPLIVGTQFEAPAGAGFIVRVVATYRNDMSGWLVFRDAFNNVRYAYVEGVHPDYVDSVRGAMRLPGEPKPGEGDAKAQGGAKPLSQDAREQVGKLCPKCYRGALIEKEGRYGAFVGCNAYPKCDFIWKKGEAQPQEPQQAKPEPQPQQEPQDDDAKKLAEILGRIAGNKAQPIDADAVRRIVEEEMAKVQPGKVEYHVRVNEGEAKQLKSRPHKAMAEVLRRAQMRTHRGMRVSQLLVGEAGTGKSTLCENVAEALSLPFVYISCSGGMSETKLVGRLTPNLQTGDEKYTPTVLVNAWEFGGVVLVDEIDGSDPNVLLVLNGMMEALFWTAPDGRTIQRHADFILIAAANTYGTGADRKYVGRNQLDAAFLDRWLVVTVDYDTDLEASLVATNGLAEKWARCRAKLRELNMRRVLSTRSLLRADMLVQQLDLPQREAVVAATEGWSQDEREKVGLI